MGIAAGAVAALFPAIGIVGALAAGAGGGAALGALAAHTVRGLSHDDLKALGEVLDRGERASSSSTARTWPTGWARRDRRGRHLADLHRPTNEPLPRGRSRCRIGSSEVIGELVPEPALDSLARARGQLAAPRARDVGLEQALAELRGELPSSSRERVESWLWNKLAYYL